MCHALYRVVLPVLLAGAIFLERPAPAAMTPVPVQTSTVVRVMAANLNNNNQSYQPFALRIFQGLKPDIVAIQEFNYASTNGAGVNTPAAMREMIDSAFGPEFSYFRESAPGYTIPNGVISRWPILEAGSWEDIDAGVNDRGFAWARLDVPGSNDLYVVSVHLKASSGGTNASRRAAEANQLKGLIQSNFPANAWVVVGGDCNIQSPDELALAVLKSFLSDSPIPTDAPVRGDPDTNNGRSERYDYVLPSPDFNTNRIATIIGSRTFPDGLVFDSRLYTPLADVAPVLSADSGQAQHMAVLKDFRIHHTETNLVEVPAPELQISATNVIRWTGLSHLTYTVQTSSALTNWVAAGTATSLSTNFTFTNQASGGGRHFYRVVYP